MMQKILSIAGIISLIIMFGFVLNYGWNKQEEHECLVWAQQSKQFAGYYFTSWQLAQCEAHEIDLTI